MRPQFRRVSGSILRSFISFGVWPVKCGRSLCVAAATRPLRCLASGPADVLQMELLVPDSDAASEDDHGTTNLFEGGESGEAGDDDAAAEIITTVDTFARAKVGNFFKRMSSSFTSPSLSFSFVAEVREVQTAGDDESLFHARLRVPLPAEYGERWGEGRAPTAKEAELVAAMHAERVIDALGFPMFQLTSKQQRHAEAARCAGRWAPMPGEGPRPPSTPSPPRLQLLREGAMKAAERRLQIEDMLFLEVTIGAFTPMKLTLASPFFLDYGSVYRIKQFFAAYNCNIQRYSRVTALHNCDGKTKSASAATFVSNEGSTMFVAQLKLPIDARFGERVACGKAETKKEAITLACMHAELIIDALGLALYPNRVDLQEAHAEECRKVNRWCSKPNEYEYHYTKLSPPPLQLVKRRRAMTIAEEVNPTSSLESVLLSHAKAVESFTNVVEIPALVPSARREFMSYIAQQTVPADNAISPFFTEALGVKGHEVYRATATVPVKLATNDKELTQFVDNNGVSLGCAQQFFVAIGIATSEFGAEVAASMHALSVLERLNCHPPCIQKERREQKNMLCDTLTGTPYRHVVGHIGRIVVPGLSAARSFGGFPPSRQKHAFFERGKELRVCNARAELPMSDWSLEADAEGYIIVDPGVDVQEGRNYVHTLPSVRRADRFAIVRLQDYLERHGRRLEGDSLLSTFVETDDGLKRWVKKIVLPVPEAFGHVVAHGEAYTEVDALVMCAVHAELILDEIGVALYDFDILQEKHCAAAEMLGRRAPYKTLATKNAVRLPPPVRKEHTDSHFWACFLKKRMDAEKKTLSCSGYANNITQKTNMAEKSGDTPKAKKENTELNFDATTSENDGLLATDDALCDLEALVQIHSSEIFRNAFYLLDMYCKRKGVDISCSMRQYNVRHPTYGLVHRAIIELPVPPQFGRRHAVGCASTKKDAFSLCCMHAIFILGELGISIYTGPKQNEYATIARSKGRYAPRLDDPLRPANTKSPPGLKMFADVHIQRPLAPTPPSCSECHKPFVWGSYVNACRGYMQKVKEHVVYDALFVQGTAPRSGVDVEDKTLEIVEAMPIFNNTKSTLQQKCASAGLPPPQPMSFRFEAYGRHPNRRYLVEQPIIGTPFVARGMGENGQEAVARAAMHYGYIVGIIADAQQQTYGGMGTMSRNRNGDFFDAILRDFTPRGKLSIMALYTMLQAPFIPLRLTLKERSGGTSDSSQLFYVSLVEMEDETGLRMAGKGEDRANAEEARNRAIAELYRQLQRKSTFQTVSQLLQKYPALCLEGAGHFPSEETFFSGLRLLLLEQKELQNLKPSPPLQEPQKQLPQSPEFRDLLDVGGLTSLSCEMGAGYLQLVELRLLFDLAERALGASETCSPIASPAAARRLLSSMGLVAVGETSAELKDRTEANALGVATAMFLLALPQPADFCKESSRLLGGGLCLQLAKLLLAGSLMNCLQLSVRLAALVIFLATGCDDDDGSRVWHKGGDVLEFVSTALPCRARHFAAVTVRRLRELFSRVGRNTSALQYVLPTLDASLNDAANDMWDGPLNDGLSSTDEARLRFAIAFATFPTLFVQKKATSDDAPCMVTVEQRDRRCATRVPVPKTLAVSYTFPFCGTSSPSSLSPSLTSPQSLSSFLPCYSSLSCFCAFHTGAKNDVISENTRGEEILPLFGTFISPCGLLLASATCNEPRTVIVAEDVPNIALVDGFIPVVMRSPESIAAILQLRLLIKLRWATLRPLTEEMQRAMDKLLAARHSLTHVTQAGLLG